MSEPVKIERKKDTCLWRLVPSANNFCKQFGPRSGSTNRFEANLFEKMVFVKEVHQVDLKILVK